MTLNNLNTSGLLPAGHRVIILPEEVVTKTSSGIIIHTEQGVDREELAQIYGRIVAVGPNCWRDSLWDYVSTWVGVKAPWAKPGDRVVFGKYSGLIFPGRDGAKYRVVNDRDIVAVVEQD